MAYDPGPAFFVFAVVVVIAAFVVWKTAKFLRKVWGKIARRERANGVA